jgi:hypothetical protein
MCEDNPIPVGSVWREIRRDRLVRITSSSDVPHWTYIDQKGNAEPHGLEPANGFRYDDWFDHCCDALDFVVWGRFERVS